MLHRTLMLGGSTGQINRGGDWAQRIMGPRCPRGEVNVEGWSDTSGRQVAMKMVTLVATSLQGVENLAQAGQLRSGQSRMWTQACTLHHTFRAKRDP